LYNISILMVKIKELIENVAKIKDGFKPIQVEAEKILKEHDEQASLQVAYELYKSNEYQARMLAVMIFGKFGAIDKSVFEFLRNTVANDSSWQVQEMLAVAFDTYCKHIGYEKALPVIKNWLKDKNHNVRRAVSEGLRIWTYRDFFKQHPEIAIQLLSSLRNDEHEYVRKSVGNALRDISRFYKDLVKKELGTWDRNNRNIAYTYSLASKFIQK